MANLAVNQVVRLTIFGRCYSQRVMLTHDYLISALSGTTSVNVGLAGFLARIQAAGGVFPAYQNCLSEKWESTYLRAQVIYPTRFTYYEIPLNEVGNRAGDEALVQSTVGIIMQTDLAGRRERATKHIGPISANDTLGGRANAGLSGAQDALGAALAAQVVVTVGSSATYSPTIYHRDGDGLAQRVSPITRYAIRDEIRTLRRRVVGRGE